MKTKQSSLNQIFYWTFIESRQFVHIKDLSASRDTYESLVRNGNIHSTLHPHFPLTQVYGPLNWASQLAEHTILIIGSSQSAARLALTTLLNVASSSTMRAELIN